MRAKLCWASFAALTLVAVLALSGCRSGDAVEDTGPQTVAVERRNLRITAEATGQVEPITSI
ncbi:MAG: hypothetical protein HY701_10445, partial [Gemmatimonadetes bacterium]|nr:hypothetical protein [Gemmatimonadota bacterium]